MTPAMAITTRREPKRVTRWPDMSRATMEPAAMASSTRPSREGARPRPSRTWGIRDAHDAMTTPEPMNAM